MQKNRVFGLFVWMGMMMFWPSVVGGSAIIDYLGESTTVKASSQRLFMVSLRSISVPDITPMLRGICASCEWVLDRQSQRVGVVTTEKVWQNYRRAIRLIDKPIAMVAMAVDIIEVLDTKQERYQHLLAKLTQPIVLDGDTSIPLEFAGLVNSGNVHVVASPRIVSKSGSAASIYVGDHIPYINTVQHANSVAQNVAQIETGVTLTITPLVYAKKRIQLAIQLQYDTVSGYHPQQDVPIVASRKIDLTVHVHSGETLVFAGLMDHSQQKAVDKVPILGDLPILGVFFRRTKSTNKTVDLIYKITPVLR